MHIYDYIIIGSGLTGLTIATRLSQETKNFLVLEANDFPGGDSRAAHINNQPINNGLRILPATEASKNSIEFLENLLNKKIVSDVSDNTIQTYEAGGFKEFVGFGEKNIEFYDQLSYFLCAKNYKFAAEPYTWIQDLQEALKDKVLTRSIVTRFGFESLDSQHPELTHVIVNGSKSIYAKNFIFTGPVKDLGLMLPDEILNVRAKAKLKKEHGWQAVCLDLFHSVAIDRQNLFLLNGTTDDELGPCVGKFLELQPNGQTSQWLSFVDSELAEDSENIGFVLKKMKRQIKRAFPEVCESIQKERIFVTSSLSAADLKLTAHLTIPNVKNLWIGSSQLSSSKNLLASLAQSQMVLASMGFQTDLWSEKSISEENLAQI